MNQRSTLAVLLILLAPVACAGEPRVLAPRQPPPRVLPNVRLPPQPPELGHGRVVLDGTDGPMRITARHDPSFVPPGQQAPPSKTGELCVTPCVVDLPVGRYRLYMTSADESVNRGDTDQIIVEPVLNVYLRAPGRYEPPDRWQLWPGAMTVLGITAAAVGAIWAAGADNATPGLVVLGTGIGVGIAGGVFWYDASRATQQDGATTFWREPTEQAAARRSQ